MEPQRAAQQYRLISQASTFRDELLTRMLSEKPHPPDWRHRDSPILGVLRSRRWPATIKLLSAYGKDIRPVMRPWADRFSGSRSCSAITESRGAIGTESEPMFILVRFSSSRTRLTACDRLVTVPSLPLHHRWNTDKHVLSSSRCRGDPNAGGASGSLTTGVLWGRYIVAVDRRVKKLARVHGISPATG